MPAEVVFASLAIKYAPVAVPLFACHLPELSTHKKEAFAKVLPRLTSKPLFSNGATDVGKSAFKVMMDLMEEPFFQKNIDKILISIIPDIESVNYGRGVGYDVIYHEPPADVAVISGTAIRTGHMTPDGSITYDETKG
jgi:hypothetical protein